MGSSEAADRRRTDHTMAERKRTNDDVLHRKLKINNNN
jgi:hypothetical protein